MLTLSAVEAHYGAAQALFGIDLTMSEGELVALLGRNGMGKTTTIRTICQLTPPSAGQIVFDGQTLNGLTPSRVARLGVGLVPEGRRCFPNLTVRENLEVAARPGHWDRARAESIFPRLAERAGQMASTLSGGEQQMLAIGRAMMTNPKLLILDEATEGLAPVVGQEIWRGLTALKSRGLSILVVDKSLNELLPLTDRCVILERGRSVWQGAADDLTPDLRDRYLGV